MLVLVEISSFGVDPEKNVPVIILKEVCGDRSVSVLVGPLEASAIAIKSLNVTTNRPLTIDIANGILKQLGGRLERVVIYDIIDHVFYARLIVKSSDGIHCIDCRPSDALSLAIRNDAPIFIREKVFDKLDSDPKKSHAEKLRNTIRSMNTIDFGRYFLE
jgi:hypothetical protein